MTIWKPKFNIGDRVEVISKSNEWNGNQGHISRVPSRESSTYAIALYGNNNHKTYSKETHQNWYEKNLKFVENKLSAFTVFDYNAYI